MNYERLPEFDRDFKRLCKRYPTLEDDLATFCSSSIELLHINKIDNQSIVQITGLKIQTPIFKAKKFACRSLKGRGVQSGIRITYAYVESPEEKIILIEIYFKGEKENEDRDRITENFN